MGRQGQRVTGPNNCQARTRSQSKKGHHCPPRGFQSQDWWAGGPRCLDCSFRASMDQPVSKQKEPEVMAHAFNPSSKEAEAGRSQSTLWVPDQPELHRLKRQTTAIIKQKQGPGGVDSRPVWQNQRPSEAIREVESDRRCVSTSCHPKSPACLHT